jgi:ADP-heptose:LPS heptosyltransferase
VALLLRTRKFDLSIDLFNNPRSALLMYLSGAPVRIGAERKGRGRLYTIQVRDDGEPKPAIEFHNQFIRAAGIEPSSVKTEIFLTEDEKREATLYLRRLGLETDNAARPIIGIHAGASWPAKRWLPGRFAELSDLATSKFHAQVFLTEGPADGEANKAVREGAARAVACAPNLPLRQLAALISQCDVFVSNDAGPMHIAVAVGTPTIGIFGPGEENIWFPYPRQDGHRALRKDVFCHPCHLDFCNRKGEGYMECMKLLDVAEVFAAVEGLVRTRQRQSLR